MKKISVKKLLGLTFLSVFSGVVSAQDLDIYVGNAKFALPIVERWVSEYKKERPEAQISIKADQLTNDGDFTNGVFVVANQQLQTIYDQTVYFGRYALVPIINSKNPLLSTVGKGLRKKDLTKLLFEKDITDDDFFENNEKDKYNVTVYSREGNAATSITLARAFSSLPDRIKGKRIVGDEIYLLNAVQRDETGITFNTLNYVYDIQSRELKPNLSILPLNISTRHRRVIESQNIDQLITLLEEVKIDEIPVDKFGLRISGNLVENAEVQNFIEWLYEHSPKFNREFGFLNLSKEELVEQKELQKIYYKLSYVQ